MGQVFLTLNFFFQHPGGIYVMEEHLGFDATVAFRSAGHSTDAFTMLNEYLIGILPKNERIYENRIRWWKRKKNKCHKTEVSLEGVLGVL